MLTLVRIIILLLIVQITILGGALSCWAVTLTSTPQKYSNQPSGVIEFADTGTSTFDCKMDSDEYLSCTSPYNFSALANGLHTIVIRATDGANISTATYDWVINSALTTSSTIQLPQSGQTKCYDSSGIELLSCDGTGQDGDVRAGVPWPSPRFSDNSNGTLTDNLTGLVWLKNASCYAGQPFSNAIASARSLASGQCGLTDGSIAGQWRVPNRNELESLVELEFAQPSTWLGLQGFVGVQYYYWSGSGDMIGSWIVIMANGHPYNTTNLNTNFNLLPVRSSITSNAPAQTIKTGKTTSSIAGDDGDLEMGVVWPSPRFIDNNNQTITDSLTGLVWAKDANSSGPSVCVPGTAMTWQGALDFVRCLNANAWLGYTDWVLPNRKQLTSLMNLEISTLKEWLASQGFINVQSNVQSSYYWSSSSYAFNPSYAWGVGMTMHNGSIDYGEKTFNNWYVLPVRGGYVQQKLSIIKIGAGDVVINKGAISWNGFTGAARTAPGDTITLTATADTGYSFTGWSGACTGVSTCLLTMDQAKSVTATFTIAQVDGVCGDSNGKSFDMVPLTGLCKFGNPTAPLFDNIWVWSWNCSGLYNGNDSPVCKATINMYPLTVTLGGNGAGNINSSPSGISCSSETTCTPFTYIYGIDIVLSQNPAVGSQFAGWSNSCIIGPSNSCTIAIGHVNEVTATFDSLQWLRLNPGTSVYFGTLKDAYRNSASGDIIQMKANDLSGNVSFDRENISVTLDGGLNDSWVNGGDYTTINGSISISNGKVSARRVILKSM